jgi:hypothetical protein
MFGWPVEQVEMEMRRLRVLTHLAGVEGYEASAPLLLFECRRQGVRSSSDQTASCLSWLAEMGLVTLRETDATTVARITSRGREAAQGLVRVPGVLPPDP